MSSYIKKNPRDPNTTLQAGSLVYSADVGHGVVLGFDSSNGKPYVFYYPLQKVYCVHADDLILD